LVIDFFLNSNYPSLERASQMLGEAHKQMQASKTGSRANLSGSPSPSVSSAISAASNTDGSPSMSPTSHHHDLLHKASTYLLSAQQHQHQQQPQQRCVSAFSLFFSF
jgi:hypothetical protein